MLKKTTRLRKIRREREITQEELYILTRRKISGGRISKLERGIYIPNNKDKKLLSKALKTPIYKLFPEDEEAAV